MTTMDGLLTPRQRVDQVVESSIHWKDLIDQLHDEAGLTDEYDSELMELVVDYAEQAAREEIRRLYRSADGRRELIQEWQERQTRSAAAATAATRA